MTQFSRTWWGKRFIEALENFSDAARLARGRSYARNGKILDYRISKNLITAMVRGSINPYFGVYKEPLYSVEIELEAIASKDWSKIIQSIGTKASLVSQLLMKKVPENIEEAFSPLNLHLLPQKRSELKTSCSCPDYENPCKHIAGTYYLVAEQLDHDPFLLFELRGLSREQLLKDLAKSPLGQALASSLQAESPPAIAVDSYYPRPQVFEAPATCPSLQEFWLGEKRLPSEIPVEASAKIPALLVKKGGDFPPFWPGDHSFITVMEDIYQRMREKNKLL